MSLEKSKSENKFNQHLSLEFSRPGLGFFFYIYFYQLMGICLFLYLDFCEHETVSMDALCADFVYLGYASNIE